MIHYANCAILIMLIVGLIYAIRFMFARVMIIREQYLLMNKPADTWNFLRKYDREAEGSRLLIHRV